MGLLLWVTVGFIGLGFVLLVLMKRGMESKLAFVTENGESVESSRDAKSMVRWIYGVALWGVISMALVVWSFHHYSG